MFGGWGMGFRDWEFSVKGLGYGVIGNTYVKMICRGTSLITKSPPH